jgi:hypothetical protein
MQFKTGKHAGKHYEEVVLKEADFVDWMFGEHADSPTVKEFKRLIDLYDKKPFVEKCSRCPKTATRTSVYINNYDPLFWCESCDPYGTGATSGKLSIVRTYLEALAHLRRGDINTRDWKRNLIRRIAEGKGLPKRVGAVQALHFFS